MNMDIYYNSEWNDFYFNFYSSDTPQIQKNQKNIKKETIDKESDEEIDLENISDEIISDEESDKEVCKVPRYYNIIFLYKIKLIK